MPTGGQAKLPRLPIEMGDHELGLTRQPPTVGEHTREVMLEAGYSAAEIEGLAAEGAVVLG
jgi:crotonobetainyl-CoA:carnitine CoA-transferase CaiB-like acyl-CoA transferase